MKIIEYTNQELKNLGNDQKMHSVEKSDSLKNQNLTNSPTKRKANNPTIPQINTQKITNQNLEGTASLKIIGSF